MAKSAIVTGYSSGLGAEFARLLLEQGWIVIGVSRKSEQTPLHEKYGSKLIAVNGSVDRQETAEAAFAASSEAADLRLVINCAGEGVFGEIGSYTGGEISATMAGNLIGLILFSDMAVRYLREQGGDIVNVMSSAGKNLRTAESVYVASKWGAKGYTRALRQAVKAAKFPIRVFEVYPCGMNTPFWSTATRHVTDGMSFPPPDPIAEQVLAEISSHRPVYCQEFTFERA